MVLIRRSGPAGLQIRKQSRALVELSSLSQPWTHFLLLLSEKSCFQEKLLRGNQLQDLDHVTGQSDRKEKPNTAEQGPEELLSAQYTRVCRDLVDSGGLCRAL